MDKLKGLASKLGSKGEGNSSTDPNAAAGSANPGTTDPAATNNQGDFLDKGVGMAGKQFGQNFDRQQEEKYSDMARQGYTKATGSDIPIKDQN